MSMKPSDLTPLREKAAGATTGNTAQGVKALAEVLEELLRTLQEDILPPMGDSLEQDD